MFHLDEKRKRFLTVLILSSLVVHCTARNGYKRDAEENDDHLLNILKDHEIIPDLIDDAPHADILEVSYGGDILVNRGDELTPTEVREQPLSLKWSADPSLFYTLLMIDPDSPSRDSPKARSWQHWIVGNIRGDNIKSGDVLTEYVGAVPARSTGLHRYVFLLFEQNGGRRDFKEALITNEDATRDKFSVREFTARYRLGQPVAVNFFHAKFDDSVPALLSKFLNLE